MISVVIPAHDEEVVLERCLSTIMRDGSEGELEIIVVANACTDRTAEIARAHDGVRVVETALPGKPHALELGDQAATTFPRLYVDADVQMDIYAVRAVADVLRRGDVHLAAPRLVVDRTGSNPLVRSYYRVWHQLPWATDEPVGSGVYGLSKVGRDRIGSFHREGADDWWVQRHISPPERRCVPDVSFTVPASRTMREVIRRKARILAAMQLVSPDLPSSQSTEPSIARQAGRLLRGDWRLAPHLVVFATASVVARRRAVRMLRQGVVDWAPDERHLETASPPTDGGREERP